LEAKENLGVDTFTVLWIKATIMEAQCNYNNITTIVAHPTLGTSKESVTQPDYLVAKFKYDVETTAIMSPRRNLKTGKMAYKKAVELSKAVIS
jgi:hypothetical protein